MKKLEDLEVGEPISIVEDRYDGQQPWDAVYGGKNGAFHDFATIHPMDGRMVRIYTVAEGSILTEEDGFHFEEEQRVSTNIGEGEENFEELWRYLTEARAGVRT